MIRDKIRSRKIVKAGDGDNKLVIAFKDSIDINF